MPLITFHERMVGPVGPVPDVPWTVRPRGPRGGDGIVRLATTTASRRPALLDLDDLRVRVDRLDGKRDGYEATITAGTVTGVAAGPTRVDAGFADILTSAVGGRRMHYRLLVAAGSDAFVVEGLKRVRGGVRGAWTATTTLHTVVVRVPRSAFPPEADARRARLAEGGIEGVVVTAGVLRVRGLLRQGTSLRGSVLPFLIGFARRAVQVGHS
ncbi:hypothetical protein [Curtobacterium luteum]|uniref:Uncharacterized protein n=1 Tax=Curtobacterium luteum TaxID=33881 RepID=A0A175RSJ3_9MICO|nr:hypothetical protein [Curtobacterium luteum]KTR06467.1 hypothetical protein NS184_08940 [Curtobacterium luteum]